jgi:hypothetical protein
VPAVRRLLLLVAMLMTAAVAAQPAAADTRTRGLDPVRTWNELAIETVRLTQASDADSARTYAMVNAAIYDAVNGIAARRASGRPVRGFALRPPAGAPRSADQTAAAVAAAHAVLARLYPDRSEAFARQRAADLAAIGGGPLVEAGVAWGETVGGDVAAARQSDGSRPVETQPPDTGPGRFPAAWSGVQYRNAAPFGIADAGRYVAPGPPPLGSLDYAAAFAEVKLLGNRDIPDQAKLDTFRYWSLPAGSAQPPGEWVKIALEVAAERPMTLAARARLLALLGMAVADVTIPTVGTKFAHRHWRPETAIGQADTDGNPLTDRAEGWRARAGSPGGTPEYVSGHSSYSAAAAAVLAGFFCADGIAFTHVTDSAPVDPGTGRPVERTFSGFSAAAAEAGRSRVFGGQHFEFSNQAGLAMGRAVAAEILARKLLYTSGQTHVGQCPR